ncbi:MAG: hypothetical protein WCA20_28915 [Candidatus Sulfotelmatobacter sp.]
MLKSGHLVALTLLSLSLLSAVTQPAQAQTTKTKTVLSTNGSIVFATSNDAPAVVSVGRQGGQAFSCDLTCTTVDYSFCLDETPGCLEGFMEVADTDLKGHITTGLNQADVLRLTATIISGSMYGASYYCYAWNSDGDCTNVVEIVAPNCTAPTCPTEVGTIDVVFTKTVPSDPLFFTATLTDDVGSYVANGEVQVTRSINDQFGDTAVGTVIGNAFNQGSGCCVGVNEQIVRTSAVKATVKPVSEQLAQTGKVADKVLRRLRALERVQAAAIAARAK